MKWRQESPPHRVAATGTEIRLCWGSTYLARSHPGYSHPRMRIWACPVTLGRFLPLGEPQSPHLYNGELGLHRSGLAKEPVETAFTSILPDPRMRGPFPSPSLLEAEGSQGVGGWGGCSPCPRSRSCPPCPSPRAPPAAGPGRLASPEVPAPHPSVGSGSS